MRTSEAPDAGAARLCASQNRVAPRLSPLTLAVATTAFFAAGLFILQDIVRTYGDAHHERTLIAKSVADQMVSNGSTAPDSTAARFNAVSHASLINGAAPSSDPLSLSIPLENLGALSIEPAQGMLAAGVAGRGAAALGLAGLFTFFAYRRRPTGMPDPLQRFNYNQLASALPLGIACWTRTGEMIVCNDHYRDRLDLGDDNLTYGEAVARLIAGGYMKLKREDDTSRLLELHREDGSCLLIDERPLGEGSFMTLISDVTERKRTVEMLDAIREDQRQLARRYHEEKLKAEAASRAKTNFLAHLSHDIRTPLNHIIGFAELMKHETYGPLGDDRYVDYVQSIKTSGDHLLKSFAAILDLAELEGGQKVLRQEPVLLDEVIETTAQRFRGQVERSGLRLKLRKPSGAVLRGDRLGLTRMIGNLVDNAIRYSRPGGEITLAAYAADDGVVIEITDTGIGMSAERLASLSQPFAMGDATFTRGESGPGLGISIARAIAELSGGHMAIDSAPALGTTVAITLPVEQAAAEMAA
jgi:two-component system cell cycle sensor histidine kinase PleC